MPLKRMREEDNHDLDSQRTQPFQQSPGTAPEGSNGVSLAGGPSSSKSSFDNTVVSPVTTSTQALFSKPPQSISSGPSNMTQSQPSLLTRNCMAPVAANSPAPLALPPQAQGGEIQTSSAPVTTFYPPKLLLLALDEGNIHSPDGRFRFIQFLTYRRSSLDLAIYENWIGTCIRICVGLDKEHIEFLSTWIRLVPQALPQRYCPQACLPPSKVDLPVVQLGHLFSTQVFGKDSDIPLYYILLIQGESQPDCGKLVIGSSREEAARLAYGQAFCGYSTVFICAICQSTRTRFLSSNPPMSGIIVNSDRCNALLARDRSLSGGQMVVSIIY